MEQSSFWFAAKRYGWGWGLPSAWQGWVVMASFFALLILAAFVFPPKEHMAAFLGSTVVLVAALLAVCFAKGEPPRWRWGK